MIRKCRSEISCFWSKKANKKLSFQLECAGARRPWGGAELTGFWANSEAAGHSPWHQPLLGVCSTRVLPAGHTCGGGCACGSGRLGRCGKSPSALCLTTAAKDTFVFFFRLAHEKAFSPFLLKYTQRAQYTWSVNAKKRTWRILKEFNLTIDSLVNS